MVIAIVQARSSSSRLPGKVLKEIQGKAMILHELERLSASRKIDKILLATSDDSSDDILVKTVQMGGYGIYRGDLNDVLARYYHCAEQYAPNHVVRITGDCPLIDWCVVDDVIVRHLAEGNDYTHTTERFPDGLDTEVMTYAALAQAHREAELPSEREHVTLYFQNHPDRFCIGNVDCAEDYGDLRWTVDEPRDLVLVEAIYEQLYPSNPDFSMQDILALLDEKPELRSINQGIVRNEGLQKSIAEDALLL